MATIEELSAALVKADAAGNTADAKAFADAIRQMRATTAPETPAPQPRGQAGAFDFMTAPFEMGMSLAQKPRAQQAAFISPTVEALGAAGGATVGSALGPVGSVVGAGAGYAGAKELMRHVAGEATPETLGQATSRVGQNVLTGAEAETFGQGIAGPLLSKAAKAAGWVWDALSGTLTQVRAGKIIRQIAGADLANVRSLAANAPSDLTAAQATQPAGVNVLAALGEKAERNDVTNYFTRLAAEQEAARRAALQGVTPNLAAAEATRKAAADAGYQAAVAQGLDVNMAAALKPQIDSLMRRPSVLEAQRIAKKLAAEQDISLTNFGSVEGLDWIKRGLDSQINTAAKSGSNVSAAELRALMQTKSDLLSIIKEVSPAYDAARAKFASLSPPVNQAQLLGEMQSTLEKPGGGERVVPFLNALGRGENALIKRAGGEPRFGGIEEVLTPQQMGVVNDIAAQFNRDLQVAQSAAAGRGGLSRILGETKSDVELPPSINVFTRFTNKLLSVMEGSVNKNTLAALEKGMRSGKQLTALIDTLPTSERNAALQALISNAKQFGRGVSFGANALLPNANLNQLMTAD